MKRSAVSGVVTLLALVLVFSIAGCGSLPSTGTTGSGTTGTPAQPAKVDPYAAIPADGTHEKAAYAAVPDALAYVQKTTKEQKRDVTDVSAGKATLFSYTLIAQVESKIVLFEVRADGKAYELYRYPTTPDPKKLFWQDAATNEGARTSEAAGTGEMAAVAAVRKVIEEAEPGKTAKIKMSGYQFVWIGADGKPVNTPGGGVFTMSIDPSGAAGSWSM